MKVTKILAKCKVIREQVKLFLKQRKDLYNPNDFINKDPLAPIIATICSERISADVAWDIPYSIYKWLKREGLDFKLNTICDLGKEKLKEWLTLHMQDRWPKKLSRKDREDWLEKISASIVNSCKKIQEEYNNDPDSIFIVKNGRLSVPHIYFILRQFPGIGPKKASMIARDFGRNGNWFRSVKARLEKRGLDLTITHTYFTEMPIDVHVKRVFRRLFPRLFSRRIEPQDLQNLARIIYPENPGLVDDFIWQLDRETCKNYPSCEKCSLAAICEYYSRWKRT